MIHLANRVGVGRSSVATAFLVPVLLAVVSGWRAYAQPAQRPSFDVVSVRISTPIPRDQSRLECDHGRFISRGAPLLWAIDWAYDLNDYQVAPGWPAWLNSFGTFDIEAKTEVPASEVQCKLMVQSLFAERFKMKMRTEMKDVSGFALVVGKSGPRISAGGKVIINGEVKQAASERDAPDGWTMARFANYLASVRGVDRPVVDKTGLAGIYGFKLDYSASEGDGHADIRTALPAQLGLALQPGKAQIEMFIIDHVENPGAN